MKYSIELISEPEHFNKMAAEWNTLLNTSVMNNPFLTWEWMYTWWSIYGKNAKLSIVTVRDESKNLVGIAPCKIVSRRVPAFRKRRRLEFIGTGGDVTTEHIDFIIKKGLETEIICRILAYILQNEAWDKADFRNFSTFSNTVRDSKDFLAAKGIPFKNHHYSVCPFTFLPETMDQLFLKKSANFRKKIKEYIRVASRDLHLQLYRCSDANRLDQDMSTLKDLNRARWGKRGRAFRTKKYILFHETLSKRFFENGWLRLFFLKKNRSSLAGIYCYHYNNKYYYYQSGRDLKYARYRLGLVLLAKAFQEAICENASEFDLLTGEEGYKLRWAKQKRTTIRLTFDHPFRKRLPALY